MTVSLIISTYNWPRALYLCLDSVMQQTVMPTEILIADDGSGINTRDVVKHFENISPVPVHHIWHEDRGFRLAAIRNKAIAASRSEYIIQIDGDLILHRKFVQDHLAFARKGRFITGSRGVLTEELTHRLLDGESVTLTLLAKGVRNKNNALRLPLLAALYGAVGPTRFVKGCNMAFWRDDLIRVNGYDETFTGWGREDTELAIRLNNIGIRQQSMKYQGIVFHLHHKQQDRDNLSANDAHYQQSVREHRTRCEKGVDQHFGPTGQYPRTEVRCHSARFPQTTASTEKHYADLDHHPHIQRRKVSRRVPAKHSPTDLE